MLSHAAVLINYRVHRFLPWIIRWKITSRDKIFIESLWNMPALSCSGHSVIFVDIYGIWLSICCIVTVKDNNRLLFVLFGFLSFVHWRFLVLLKARIQDRTGTSTRLNRVARKYCVFCSRTENRWRQTQAWNLIARYCLL